MRPHIGRSKAVGPSCTCQNDQDGLHSEKPAQVGEWSGPTRADAVKALVRQQGAVVTAEAEGTRTVDEEPSPGPLVGTEELSSPPAASPVDGFHRQIEAPRRRFRRRTPAPKANPFWRFLFPLVVIGLVDVHDLAIEATADLEIATRPVKKNKHIN